MAFQDHPCAAGQRSTEIERAESRAEGAALPALDVGARLQMPAAGDSGEGMGSRIDTAAVRSTQWLDAIARAGQRAPLRSGSGRITLLRVLLEGDRNAVIQLMGTKLVGLDEVNGGGGTYREISHGDFVLMEHVHSTSRRGGKDVLKIGSSAHGQVEIRVPVPEAGALAVFGDVILSEASAQQKGVLEATIAVDGVAGLAKKFSMLLGPIAVGGRYGETIEFDSLGRTRPVLLAPGSYEIALPDFDVVNSRFSVELGAGERLQIHFRAKSPEVVELLGADREPRPAAAAP